MGPFGLLFQGLFAEYLIKRVIKVCRKLGHDPLRTSEAGWMGLTFKKKKKKVPIFWMCQ